MDNFRRNLRMRSDVQQTIRDHLGELVLRDLRVSTRRNRRYVLGRLARAHDDRDLLTLTEADLRAWQEVRVRQVASDSVRVEIEHVREFYRWAVREGLRPDDPSTRLLTPKTRRRLPRPMPEDAFAEALAAADLRTRAILALAGYAGLRAMEVAQLDWSEVDLRATPPSLRVVNGKGGVGRTVFVSPGLAAALRALPEHRGAVIRRADGGRGYNEASRVSAIANRHLHVHEIPETLHQLRHRFAAVAYQSEADIRAVQELLGHQSPATTAIYAAPGADARWRAVLAAGAVSGVPAA